MEHPESNGKKTIESGLLFLAANRPGVTPPGAAMGYGRLLAAPGNGSRQVRLGVNGRRDRRNRPRRSGAHTVAGSERLSFTDSKLLPVRLALPLDLKKARNGNLFYWCARDRTARSDRSSRSTCRACERRQPVHRSRRSPPPMAQPQPGKKKGDRGEYKVLQPRGRGRSSNRGLPEPHHAAVLGRLGLRRVHAHLEPCSG